MRNPLSKHVYDVPFSGIRKFFDIALTIDDCISLGVGEPDFDTPMHIRAAGIKSLEEGHTSYTSNYGLIELRQEIANYVKKRQGIDYDPNEEILVTVGGSEGIDMAMRAMIDPGDEVLIPQPCYVSFEPCAIFAGGVPNIINLKSENEFRLTPEELREHITEKSKILVLSFPNNPTGAIMEKEDLEKIAEVVIENDLYVISDEIYGELSYKNTHVSIASLPGMRERTLMVNGFSKAYSMTGWRMGFVCGPKNIMEQVIKIHQYAIMCAPTTSQYAATEAIKNGDEDIAAMKAEYDKRRKFLVEEFKKMGLPCFEPLGAFYIFPDIRKFGLSSDEFCTRLLNEQRLVVVPGTAFGKCGEGFVRISYAYSMDELARALERLKKFIDTL